MKLITILLELGLQVKQKPQVSECSTELNWHVETFKT